MIVEKTKLNDLLLIKPKVFNDERGYFYVSWNSYVLENIIGRENIFVQDNHSKSSKGVLRGLHYQIEHPQGKLIRCTQGAVYDAFVDIRQHSETFGKSLGIVLDRPEQLLWIPPGFAHGFYTLTDNAQFEYKCTDYYHPKSMKTLMWDDPDLSITWPTLHPPLLSEKDAIGETFKECEKYE